MCVESEKRHLLQEFQEAQQEQEKEQQQRSIDSEKRMLRDATKQLEEDLMDQGPERCTGVASTCAGQCNGHAQWQW